MAAKKKTDPAAARKKKKVSTLSETTIKTLNARLDTVESDLRVMARLLATTENMYNKTLRKVTAADDDAEALLNAVRILAAEIPSNTGVGRKVRGRARLLLEARKIPPPSTLGASRKRHNKKQP